MGVKLVAFDLDGTILESGELIRDEVLDALRQMSRRGIICTTATGRPHDFQIELFDRYDIGAESGVLRALIGDEREIFLNNGREFASFAAWNNPLRERWIDVFPVAMSMLAEAEAESVRNGFAVRRLLPDDVAFARGLPTLTFETPEAAEIIESWIEAQLQARPELPLTTNRNVRLVQVFDRLVGKGLVLAEVARYFGIAHENVLALGDSSNDYTMLNGRLGFRCATFANAEDRLKAMVAAAGGFVASSPAGLGVVEAFRHYGLVS